MPLTRGYNSRGLGYYRWGQTGKQYWYEPHNKAHREEAKALAMRQGRAIAARRRYSLGGGKKRRQGMKRKRNSVKKVWNPKYVPAGLSKRDKRRHIEHMLSGQISPRPKVKSYPKKQSKWKSAFEAKYGKRSFQWITENLISEEGANKILNKGYGAYVSSGSRPNQTAGSWAYARLYSVLMGGPARAVDNKIWTTYKLV